MDCKVQVTFCIFLTLVIGINMGSGQESLGECTCGGFRNLEHLDTLIIKRELPNGKVSCDDDGAINCQRKCKRIMNRVPVNIATNVLCLELNTTDIPEMHLFAKNCDAGNWTSIGEKLPNPICCRDGKSVNCNSEQL